MESQYGKKGAAAFAVFSRGEADLDTYAKRFDRYYKSGRIGLSFDQIPAELIAESPHLAKVAFDAGVRDAKETTGDSFTALVQKGYTGKITEANGLPEELLKPDMSKETPFDTATSTRVIEESLKSGFAKNLDDVLTKYGITLDEFHSLRLKDVSTLSESQKSTLKEIRESIPMPDANTIMQKVIPYSDIENYVNGNYTQISGYTTRAEDVSQLMTYDDLYDSLRLDYPGTKYKPMADSSLGVIRYTMGESSNISIPYGIDMGGTVTDVDPFTGNGFTKSTNGQVIPEFKCDGYMDVSDGAQLIEISKDGSETLRAVYSEADEMFIAVK